MQPAHHHAVVCVLCLQERQLNLIALFEQSSGVASTLLLHAQDSQQGGAWEGGGRRSGALEQRHYGQEGDRDKHLSTQLRTYIDEGSCNVPITKGAVLFIIVHLMRPSIHDTHTLGQSHPELA